MKYSLDAIPVEVLVLAFIEFVFVSTFAECFGTCLGTTDPMGFIKKLHGYDSLEPDCPGAAWTFTRFNYVDTPPSPHS
jgi:hypothetical protein